jgi:hypothetical protein
MAIIKATKVRKEATQERKINTQYKKHPQKKNLKLNRVLLSQTKHTTHIGKS